MNSEAQVKRILILTANPKGTNKLRLDEEARDIQEGLRRAKERDRFEIQSVWAVRSRDIRRALLDFKPHIVHFSGHGAADAGLAFENELGQVHLIASEALAGLFKLFASHVECVVLNACYSDIQASAIVEHIDFVVGMNQAIGDKAAIEFSIGFYDALMAGFGVEVAYEFGCNAIHLAGIQEHLTPMLQKKDNCIPMDRGDANPKHPSPEKGSVTRTITIQSPSKIVYEFVLSGNINEFDKQRLEAIVAHLQQITGDVNLTLLRVEDGSVKLIFEGSEEGFKRIQELIEEGRLTEILGAQIQAVQEQQPLRTAEYRRSLILDPIPSSTSNSVLCCYVNGTSQIQIARITNVQNWYFERVVFPGQRLIFEAVPEAILEIHTGTMASAILSDTIPCTDLSLTAVDELDKYSSDQLARPFIEEERSI